MKRQRISPVWRLQTLRRWLTGQSPVDEPRLIHRDRDLAVAWLPGSSKTLVLVFISIRREALHPQGLEFSSIASDNGRNHVLFINDRERSWYSMPGQRDRIIRTVRSFMDKHAIETVQSIGTSMGGHGAILFSGFVPISSVVAFVPQILMTKAVTGRPVWNAHRPRIRDAVEQDLTPIMAAADCRFNIVTGDKHYDDPIHLAHVRKQLSHAGNVKVVIAPGQKHNVYKWLDAKGQLTAITAALWAGDRHALEDCSNALPQPLDLTLA
ncbi:hypothetical protein MCELHM10_01774 [Paracoccaceae bacterium]|jgi:hypothetical protein